MSLADLKQRMAAPIPGGRRFAALRRGIGVKNSEDLERILALPRRKPVDTDWLTQGLRRVDGRQELRPAQAQALYDLAEGGLAAPMRVGSGKTLVTLLAAELLDIERVVLLVPKALVDKTMRDYAEYLKHWRVRRPRVVGYELLGRKQAARMLHELRPGLILADEAHKLKNPKAAVTRRVTRYIEETGCRFVPLSGSMLSNVSKAHHLFGWALGQRSPLPLLPSVAEEWDGALDPQVPLGQRADYGALRRFGTDPARAYRQWVYDSPGVVAVSEVGCDASIVARHWRPELPDVLRRMIAEVELTKKRPDGEVLDPLDVARCQSQLACGGWIGWDPMPPEHWLAARRVWTIFCNSVLEHPSSMERGLDSPEQVAAAYPEQWEAWAEVKKTFTPNPVWFWVDDTPLKKAVEWAREGNLPGIVWSSWREVGARLQKLGLPHHGARGYDNAGRHIESATGPVSASIKTCGTGTNLQHYSRNLILNPPTDIEIWEQLMGRTHRDGQPADEVLFDFYTPVEYHRRTLRKALDAARSVPEEQKLALATWV